MHDINNANCPANAGGPHAGMTDADCTCPEPEPKTHPVQTCDRKGGRVPVVVTMAAYEVYKAVFGEQQALVTGNCRGGFGTGELIGFLYARNFPRAEWSARFQEAITGMVHVG